MSELYGSTYRDSARPAAPHTACPPGPRARMQVRHTVDVDGAAIGPALRAPLAARGPGTWARSSLTASDSAHRAAPRSSRRTSPPRLSRPTPRHSPKLSNRAATVTVFNLQPAFLGLQNNIVDNDSALDTEYKGVEFTAPVRDQGWGLVTAMQVPGGGELGLYQPLHATAV